MVLKIWRGFSWNAISSTAGGFIPMQADLVEKADLSAFSYMVDSGPYLRQSLFCT